MRIAIVGAGAAGLSAAYDLSAASHEVTLYEAGAEVGGLAAGFKDSAWDWTLEKFYHHWFSTDQDMLGLIEEIGQSEKVRFYSPNTSVWHERGTFPLDAPVMGGATISRLINVLRLPDLPLFAKLRFGFIGMAVKLIPRGTFLEKWTANDWLRRWTGKRAHDFMWKPLLIGKFGPLYDQVNMAWMWARLNKRTAQLGTYVGGFQAMLEDLADTVRSRGVEIHLNARIDGIAPAGGGGFEVSTGGDSKHYDQVLSTTSPQVMLKLAPTLPEADSHYAAQLEGLRSMSAMVLILALDRQLMADGTYWLNLPANSPKKEENPFPYLALVEHTNYVSKDHFNGEHIIYLGDYLSADHENFAMTEEELTEYFLPSLKKVNADFSESWIRRLWVFKAPYAQPVPFVNHSQNIPAIRTPHKGLYFASMSQVYPWDRGTNYAVEMGRRTARMMMEDAEE